MTTPAWFAIDKSITDPGPVYEAAVTFIILNDLDPKGVCKSGRLVGEAVVDCISKAITVEQLEEEIGRAVEDGVDKHLPGRHDQKEHGRPGTGIKEPPELAIMGVRRQDTREKMVELGVRLLSLGYERVRIGEAAEAAQVIEAMQEVAEITEKFGELLPKTPLNVKLLFEYGEFVDANALYDSDTSVLTIGGPHGEAVAHELGHVVDMWLSVLYGPHESLGLSRSELMEISGKTNVVHRKMLEIVNDYMTADPRHAEEWQIADNENHTMYWTDPAELFGRAFEQYFTLKTGYAPKKGQGLRAWGLDRKHTWVQPDGAFLPIAAKMDELFSMAHLKSLIGKHLPGQHDQQDHGREGVAKVDGTANKTRLFHGTTSQLEDIIMKDGFDPHGGELGDLWDSEDFTEGERADAVFFTKDIGRAQEYAYQRFSKWVEDKGYDGDITADLFEGDDAAQAKAYEWMDTNDVNPSVVVFEVELDSSALKKDDLDGTAKYVVGKVPAERILGWREYNIWGDELRIWNRLKSNIVVGYASVLVMGPVQKHLAGRHDQQTHAGARTAGEVRVNEDAAFVTDETLAAVTFEDMQHWREQTYELIRKIQDGPSVSDILSDTPEAKKTRAALDSLNTIASALVDAENAIGGVAEVGVGGQIVYGTYGQGGQLEAFSVLEPPRDGEWHMQYMATAPWNNHYVRDILGMEPEDNKAPQRLAVKIAKDAVQQNVDLVFEPASEPVAKLYRMLGAVPRFGNKETGKNWRSALKWSVDSMRKFVERYDKSDVTEEDWSVTKHLTGRHDQKKHGRDGIDQNIKLTDDEKRLYRQLAMASAPAVPTGDQIDRAMSGHDMLPDKYQNDPVAVNATKHLQENYKSVRFPNDKLTVEEMAESLSEVSIITSELKTKYPNLPLNELNLIFFDTYQSNAAYDNSLPAIMIFGDHGESIVHEIGHFVDAKMGDGAGQNLGQFGSQKGLIDEQGGTNLPRRIVDKTAETPAVMDWISQGMMRASYLTNPKEIFARGFEQTVAIRSELLRRMMERDFEKYEGHTPTGDEMAKLRSWTIPEWLFKERIMPMYESLPSMRRPKIKAFSDEYPQPLGPTELLTQGGRYVFWKKGRRKKLKDAIAAVKLKSVIEEVKHLVGKHDQKTHGRGLKPTPSVFDIPTSTIDRNDTEEDWKALDLRRPTDDELMQAFGMNLPDYRIKVHFDRQHNPWDTPYIDITSSALLRDHEGEQFEQRQVMSRRITNIDEPTATHLNFDLPLAFQGKGMGTDVLERTEALYRDIGVKRIKLVANSSVGRYAWARLGFDFDGELDEENTLSRSGLDVNGIRQGWHSFAEYLDEKGMPKAQRPRINHTWELAAWRTDKVQGGASGKDFLLRYSQSYNAIKRLDDSDIGYRIGQEYYRLKKEKRNGRR